MIRTTRRQFVLGSTAFGASLGFGLHRAWAQENRLRQIFWGSQARADRTYGVNELYGAETGTAVEGEFLAWNDYWPKLATQTAGGNAPDVIQMDYRYIVEYANRGAIAPLDEFVGGVLDIADADQDQIEGGKVNGQLYGISLGANSVAMMVNRAAFEEAGIELPGPNTTYDDIRSMGEAFAAANVRDGMRLIADGSASEPAFENWLRQRGKALYTAEGQLGFSPEDMTEWFQLWQDLREAGVAVAAEEQALDTGALETNTVTLGHAALSFSNSNQLVAMQALNQDPITITNFPRIATDAPGGHYRKPSMFWSVGGASANKEEAARYVSFFVNNPEAAAILGVERGIPISAAVRDALAPSLDEQSQVALNFVANLGDLLSDIPPPPPANAGEVATALLTKSQEVGFGAQSPQDAGPAFHAEATEILSRAQ